MSQMTNTDIRQFLAQTFDDEKLSNSERSVLRERMDELQDQPDRLNFTRNLAFELVREQLRIPGANHCHCLKWLEQVVKTIDAVRAPSVHIEDAVLFSPGDECVNAVVSAIRSAKQSIDVCVFTISDDRISRALMKAYHKGITVRILTDNDKADDRGSDVWEFVETGLPVKMDNTRNHIHHKFALFDGCKILNGSFNWTRSASRYNHENIVVSYDKTLLNDFSEEFERLWGQFELTTKPL